MVRRAQIKLNGAVLPPEMIAAEAQYHPATTPRAAANLAARALIVRTLLLEEAIRRGLDATPEVVAEGRRETADEARVRTLLENNVPVATPADAEIRRFYDENLNKFMSPTLFEASHILFGPALNEKQSRLIAEAKTRDAIREINEHPAHFETIAREQSMCGSGSNGGRLGQVSASDLVPEFRAALLTLQVGEIFQQPVHTQFGYHIIRLDARVEGETLPFDYVRDRIELYLSEKQWRDDVSRYIEALLASADIEGVDLSKNVTQESIVL